MLDVMQGSLNLNTEVGARFISIVMCDKVQDFIELEKMLKNCISLIRIDLISCKELPNELLPFQRMLTKSNAKFNSFSSDYLNRPEKRMKKQRRY